MTAPFEIDIEDDRFIPMERSHLAEGKCACGNTAFYAQGRRPRCGVCLRADADSAPVHVFLDEQLPRLGQGYPPHVETEQDPFPAPEVTSRDCWDGCGAPAVVEKLAERARALGWRVKAQRSRGCFPHGTTGAPSAPRDLYGLVFNKGGASAYAVRDGSTWSSVMLWGAGQVWFPLASVTDLGEYLEADGLMLPQWYSEIRLRLALQAQREEERKGCDKGLHLGKHLAAVPFFGPWRGETAGWWCALCRHGWRTGAEPWRKPKKGRAEAN